MAQLSGSGDSANLTSAAVFGEYRDRIFSYILRLVRDPAEADDLVQETFLRVHKQLASLRDPATVSPWLYRIATNVAYDRLRQRARQPAPGTKDTGSEGSSLPEDPPDRDAPRIDQAFEQAEMSACVQEFIEELPDDYRAAILLHDLQGLTNPEIAEVLGCSLDTVKIRLHRARQKLREALATGCDFSHDERGVFVCDRHSPQK
jgi:RNA polymerase sigma-70 factor (ECF subfamily)